MYLCGVHFPKDPTQTRKFVLEIITVPVLSDPGCTHGKGETGYDLGELNSCYFYENVTTKGKVDATIVITLSKHVKQDDRTCSDFIA